MTTNITAQIITTNTDQKPEYSTRRGHTYVTRDRRGRIILNAPQLRLRMTKADAYALANMLVDTAEKPSKPRR